MTLRHAISTPEGKRRYVRSLFATIADRYDFITVALSYGQDRRWKRRVIAMAAPRPGSRALDLATGTGDIAFGLARLGARVVGLDITQRMIELARDKAAAQPAKVGFLVGDMLALPFPDRSFDIVTTGYGLRNVPDLDTAIREVARVLRPGGRFLSLDFNRPESTVLRVCFLAYLTVVGGLLGWLLHGDPDTYRYIPASIQRYPGGEGVAARLSAHGFTNVRVIPLLFGLMTLHSASGPARSIDSRASGR